MKRRGLLQSGAVVLLLGAAHIARGAGIVAVRVWPAPDYTRVTIESDRALKTTQTFVPNPPRLAVDIEGIDLNPALKQLVAKVRPDDPNIAGVRVGQSARNVVRLVIDLKVPALPQVFNLPPVAAYQHRLVLDLYPSMAVDPLETLISDRFKEKETAPVPPAAAAIASESSAAARDPLGELIAQRDRKAEPSVAAASSAPGALPASPSGPSANTQIAAVPAGSTNAPIPATKPGSAAQNATPARTDRLIIVALDAGHGGEDPGAAGPGGTHEKDVVLKIAHLLRDRINATTINGNQMRAFMTRDSDFFVPLNVRVQKAQRVQADLFVSIHADAFFTPHPQGASVFALSQGGASSSAARWMADKENKADQIGGLNVATKDAEVKRALFDMSTTAQINDSLMLGNAMLGEIKRVGKLHKGSVEQASFAVLKAPDIPSVLVEAAFISNPDEEARLNDVAYQTQLADALMRGIQRYFARNPPLARSRAI